MALHERQPPNRSEDSMAQPRSRIVARTNNASTAQTGGKSGSRAFTATPARRGHPGNITTASGLWPPLLRAKLTVSHPGDRYEQEADRVADEVLRMLDPAVATPGIEPVRIHPLSVRRLCPEREEEKPHRQPKRPTNETNNAGLETVATTLRQPGR